MQRKKAVPALALLLCCLGVASCFPNSSESAHQADRQIIYEAGGVFTSSTLWMRDDAYAFLGKNGLQWGKVARIERTRRNIIYVVFSTANGSGNPNRLRWVSPGVVQMADAYE